MRREDDLGTRDRGGRKWRPGAGVLAPGPSSPRNAVPRATGTGVSGKKEMGASRAPFQTPRHALRMELGTHPPKRLTVRHRRLPTDDSFLLKVKQSYGHKGGEITALLPLPCADLEY